MAQPIQTRRARDYSTGAMLGTLLQPPRRENERDKPQAIKPIHTISERNESRHQHDDTNEHTTAIPEEHGDDDFNLGSIEEQSSYEQSMTTTGQTTVSHASGSRVTNFFGSDVFQVVLRNPTTAHQLRKFANSRLCGENTDFLEQVDQYQQSLNSITKSVVDIHRNFVSSHSSTQINLPENVLNEINKNLRLILAKTIPSMETAFLSAQNDVERLVASDIYPPFVRHQITMSAMKALASNKKKYAGLGDCFVLTKPSMADNPIVFVSDGFVKVTGYERDEIIPRNCRFLQNKYTDRRSLDRLKHCLEESQESVDLLLNERKNGEPFWNLLYCSPLRDQTGQVAFFLGGQVNVSTTVHNASDVLRVLSCSAEDDEEGEEELDQTTPPVAAKPSKSSIFLPWSRSRSSSNVRQVPGMENGLLKDLDNMPLRQHKEAFYTAYSKYLVIDASSKQVAFYSEGILDLFYATRRAAQAQIVGSDVFKFLAQHAANSLPRDYKSRVKSALKAGSAISLNVSLCTRRFAGAEIFATHWTPLKDGTGVTGWIVLTLGSAQDSRHLQL